MNLNLASIKASRIPAALGVCDTDPRLVAWLNEAEDMMLNQGRWWGSIRRVQFCVHDGCLVFPRAVASIEQIAVCGLPVPIVTNWYSFTQNLATVQQCGGCSSGCSNSPGRYPCGHIYAEDHGTAPSFNVTKGSNKVIRFYPSNASDAGKKIIVQGYDSNNIWVRSSIDSVIQDGEQVTLALPFVDTTTEWYPGSPTAIIKDPTNYLVRMYSYDTSTTLEVLLAEYQPDETLPAYRKMFMPCMDRFSCCDCDSSSDENPRKTVTAIAKLAHVPIALDNDPLILTNIGAYKAAMTAVKAAEEGDFARFSFFFYGTQASPSNNRGALRVVNRGGAIPLLAAELRSMTGDRVDAYIHREATNRLPYDFATFR